ncbi:acetylxylan esterase [Streptomyces scopuliridis]|uniref:acetylxylan esterase n=1 Tax=Streptomyces scopuliridis TaxID=452529 RepID=UPI00368CE65E
MALFDLPLDQLTTYRPDRDEPADFDSFWQRTLDETASRPLDPVYRPYDAALTGVTAYDTEFTGYGGDRVHAWLLIPAGCPAPMPCVVHYLGYGAGRGLPHDHLVWPAAGRAVLVMDTRGQGAANPHSAGATGDPHGAADPQAPGFVTRGILDPGQYYYRRVFTDAVRAVDAAAAHPAVDDRRIVVHGASQGGAIAQAAAALRPGLEAAMIDVPFLTHVRRAVDLTDQDPYREVVRFLAAQRVPETVFRTLSYFDGLNFAARATIPALYSVALRDTVCPPSTVFAAYHHWAGERELTVYPWNGHEGGAGRQRGVQLRYLRSLVSAAG